MEKQKKIQKGWYEVNAPVGTPEMIQISLQVHIKNLKALLPVKKTQLSLNCGCGTGGQNGIFGRSIGMDISFENIRSLRKGGELGVVADMEFLPFKDGAFDVVYGFGVLHHLHDIQAGVREAARVVKKGGLLGFGGENNGWCPLNYVMPFVYRNWRVEMGFYRIRGGNLREIFRKSGVEEFRIVRAGMTVFGLGRTVYRLTSRIEGLLSELPGLGVLSGYCYVAGRKKQ